MDFKGGLGQTSFDLLSLEELHADDLARIGDLTVLVEPSREAWEKEYDARRQREEEPPAISSANVRFRLWSSSGMRFEVQGPGRTEVEGLAGQLTEILKRGAPPLSWIDFGLAAIPLALPLLTAGFFLGTLIPQWVGLAEKDGKYEASEIAGICVGLVIAALTLLALWRAFPNVELLDEGQLPRHRRLRRFVLAACGGIALTVLGIVLGRVFN
jgi:hypothetical protein